MPKNNEKGRMLMGVWASAPERTKALLDERQWAESIRTAMNDAEGSETWGDLIREIDKELARYAALRLAVDRVIAPMSETHKAVAVMRYEGGESYLAIARKLGYSVDRVRHMKSEVDGMVGEKVEEVIPHTFPASA